MAAFKKDRIKDQMVNTAARLWGLDESEIENNFDPLIQLLIEACAAELEKIGNNITESHTRLIDFLAEVILPESLFVATPASGVIQAAPLEADTVIDTTSDFYLTQTLQRPGNGRSEMVEMHLSPIGKFNLLKTELAYLVAGNKLYRLKENNSRELLYAPERLSHSNEIWLALSTDKKPLSLKGLSIYFDLRSHSAASGFYNALAYAGCSHHDSALEGVCGFDSTESVVFDQQAILQHGDDRKGKINRKVAYIYQKRFLTITGSPKTVHTGVPEELKSIYPKELLSQLEAENLVFLKISLPQYFPQEVFDAVSCQINAFPVVNKKLNHFNYRTDDWLNIIPLPVEGAFFDLESVKNEKGESYKIRPSAGMDNLVAGEAIVRTSGVGKSSSPDVREMIGHISETIRDQSAYFGQISNDFILSRLREIGKILAGMEDNIASATDQKPSFNYLMLRPRKNGEMISISYWTTHGSDANQIRAGASLSANNDTRINSKKIHTLTNFTGGKHTVNENEKRNILRQQLLSGGKIISAEDVKVLCRQLYGDRLKQVDVQKGVQVSNKPGDGFKRTIDVTLQYSVPVTEANRNEFENLYRELEYQLESGASPVYPYRIIEKND